MGSKKFWKRFRDDQKGSVALWAGFSMPMVLGLGALAFDMNNLYVTKAELQHTADASAIAAARALPDVSAAVAAAQNYAQLNMPSAKHGSVILPADVTAGNWDASNRVFTPGASPVNAVQVAARRDQQNGNPMETSIASAIGVSSVNVSASSIAAIGGDGSGGPCILALNETASAAFHMHGTAEVRTDNCHVHVNSNHPTEAVLATGNTLVQMDGNAGLHKSVGGVEERGPALFVPGIVTHNPPSSTVVKIDDPYMNVAKPDSSGACLHTNFSSTSSVTLQPGIYCGDTSITGNGIATFASGLYIFKGELFIAGTMDVTNGSGGVSIYMTGADANLRLAGTADIGLEARTVGPLPGFVFFGDRDNPATDPHTIRGTVLGGYKGIIYLPGAKVDMGGTADGTLASSDCTIIVADTFEFGGTPIFGASGECSDFEFTSASGTAQIVN